MLSNKLYLHTENVHYSKFWSKICKFVHYKARLVALVAITLTSELY